MRILAVDIGAGTQDILLFDTDRSPENCFKLVMPAPTMMVARRVKEASRRGTVPLLLTGVTMGGGPSHWAVRDHAAAGNPVYATPAAAQTFDDDLARMQKIGVEVIGTDEIGLLRARYNDLLELDLHDFDYGLLGRSFEQFGLDFSVDGVAVAVFDHGAAPPDVSDRQFRFDYLDEHIRRDNRLSGFAFMPEDVPPSMTRLQAVATSATATGMPGEIPLLIMDTAPAAVLGAMLDPVVAERERALVVNVGNFHTLAFRLTNEEIEGVFEHHTGFLDTAKLDNLIERLVDGSLTHAEVFGNHGHGALVYCDSPAPLDFLGVTGPRRSLMRSSRHPVHFAVPFGDMMMAGCFGLVRAWADVYLQNRESILDSLAGVERAAPWELL